MRISGGSARGVTLRVPKGDRVRPATDGLRQAVFSSLQGRVVGARFLDLFAGSGSYGLEAWSRGAVGGVSVECDARALACLRANVEEVARSARLDPQAVRVAATEVALWRPRPGEPGPDLVFVDPPYERISEWAPELWERLAEWCAGVADPLVVFEHPGGLELAVGSGWVVRKVLGRGVRQPTAALVGRG